MKRRDFFKVITGFVGGAFAAFVPKAESQVFWICSDGIDLNSEWAKQSQGLTLEKLKQCRDELDIAEEELPWKKFFCKDCYRECRHFDQCLAILNEKVKGQNPKDGCVISAKYIKGQKEITVYIDGKKAKKEKDGSYRAN